MNEQERIDFLFDCAQKLLDEADKQQSNVNKLISNTKSSQQSLNSSINRLDSISQNVENDIRRKVDFRSREISEEISENILEKFTEANEYAEVATEQYKKASNWLGFKAFVFSFIFSILILIGASFVLKYYVFDGLNVSFVDCTYQGEPRKCLKLEKEDFFEKKGLYLLNIK